MAWLLRAAMCLALPVALIALDELGPEQMPVPLLKSEYMVNATLASGAATVTGKLGSTGPGSNYVFLQKFPLQGPFGFYHTEVLVCPRAGFTEEDQQFLDGTIAGMSKYALIERQWWILRTANYSCVQLGYAGGYCDKTCCTVPESDRSTHFGLNERRSVIWNVWIMERSLYLYGTGEFDGIEARKRACTGACWSPWKGTDYNPITNNCNTFTSTILHMVYGLSQSKPGLGVSDMRWVEGDCPEVGEEALDELGPERMPVPLLKSEYMVNATLASGAATVTGKLGSTGSGSNFVFLQKFPLQGPFGFYHTEVLVCPRAGFTEEDQQFLDGTIAGMSSYALIERQWWILRTANYSCVQLGYAGGYCDKTCCTVPESDRSTHFGLNERRSVIWNVWIMERSLYLYGTGEFDGIEARKRACTGACWSPWKGTDYNPITNNCNTFTSTILHMVYGLSQGKPGLGVSDMRWVEGDCPEVGEEALDELGPEQMPVPLLKSEYMVNATLASGAATDTGKLGSTGPGSNFVFLQKFPLQFGFYHTEVLVCPRAGFTEDDQQFLDGTIAGMSKYALIERQWWMMRTANYSCVQLGYAGGYCDSTCCAVPETDRSTHFGINERRSVIRNVWTTERSLYLYGTGEFDGIEARKRACSGACWSPWKGTDYNPITNNCNTFTSTILHMVYGLSQSKPGLGVSDMRWVEGDCPEVGEEALDLIV